MSDDPFRASVQEFGMMGVAAFSRALNLTADMARPWVVSAEVREQATYHLRGLVELVETAELMPNPGHGAYRAARDDKALRKLLNTLDGST